MLQSGHPYPIILNSLNLIVCIRGALPEIKLANTTKNLILNQLLEDQSKFTPVKSLGIDSSPSKLPNALLTNFSTLKDALVKVKTDGVNMVFISSLKDIKYEGKTYRIDAGSFSENMNKTVNELIDLAKTFEITLVVGVDITKLENIPPYALNKKANLWVIEDRDHKTNMNHNRNKVNYNVDFDPHSGISFELNQKMEVTFNNDKEIIAMKEELNVLSNEIQGVLSSKEVGLENLAQVSKKISQVSETIIHKILQQIKLKDLLDAGLLSIDDKLILSHKGQINSLDLSLENGEVVLKDGNGDTYKTPSGAASTIMGRNANGWNELQAVDKNGNTKGDLIGIREVLVQQKSTYKVSKITPVVLKNLSGSEKVFSVFKKAVNKTKMLDYLEVYHEVNKDFPGTFKGQTPEATVSAILSTLAKEGKLKVAKPSGGKSKYYL